jgi:ferritin-like metal-binding protein YciE
MEEMANLLNAETQLVDILPKMAQASKSSAVKSALEGCLTITREHVDRIEDIFSNIGQKPSKRVCKAIQGFIEDIEDIVYDPEEYPARDAAIVKVVQRVEQYEIVEYKKSRVHASDLGHTRIVELFTKTLNEHREMNSHLNELAQDMINLQAIEPGSPAEQANQQRSTPSITKSGGFYIPAGKSSKRVAKKIDKSTDGPRFIQNPEEQEDLS